MRRAAASLVLVLAFLPPVVRADASRDVWLSDLDLAAIRQGWGNANKNRSVVGQPLKIAGRNFDKGVGTHANSEISINLKQKAVRFSASVGLDDDSRDSKNEYNPAVRFVVIGDGRKLWESPVMIVGREARKVDLDVSGVRFLSLLVVMANDRDHYEHADWIEAKLAMQDETRPEMLREPPKENDAVVAGCFKGMKKGRPSVPKAAP